MSPRIAIIGAGQAGLMAAEVLSGAADVTVYDRMPSAGRKLLMAGRGGLNLTHSEELPAFLRRYGAAEGALRAAVEAFPPAAAQAWCEGLGQPTFVGSSGRVFPRTMKASPLLRAWLRRLDAAGVRFALRHHWVGWDDEARLAFATPHGPIHVDADATVLALGGASWPRLGSDGGWADVLMQAGVAVSPLRPSNCGFLVGWSEHLKRHAGQPLKRISLSFGDHTVRGEAIITASGIEGGAIYALSAVLRHAIDAKGEATVHVALRPDLALDEIGRKLTLPRGRQSLSTFLRKTLKLSPVEIALLQESTAGKVATLAPAEIARLVNAVPVRLAGIAPIARAISSAGGVAFGDIDASFMLRRHPGIFVAGEMLDWEAPTGGYLLQACFATGVAAGRGVLEWLSESPHPGGAHLATSLR
jgi:uncharacterized flavoprotein (TIGR03862 family)